ncbi:hypothetical protein SS33_24745 [Enterobacter kobei]|nr:hypothetical protein SS33_24745 [Enterobacter kobei]
MPALNSGHTIRHIAAPYLIRLCHCELSLKVIWDSDVLMATTFIPVGGLLTTHQSQFFHEPAGKPASHSEASQGCHDGDTSRASRAMANVMQLQNLTT